MIEDGRAGPMMIAAGPPNRYMASKVNRRTLGAEDFLSDLIVTVGND